MAKIYFRGQDRLQRVGIYHDHGDQAIVVGCHGLFSWKGDETSKFFRLAESFSGDGISFFRIDCTGCGESGGRFSQSTLTQRITDITEALIYLKMTRRLRAETPLFLIGSSFGGPVVLTVASRIVQKVHGIVTWSAPIDLYDFYRERNAVFFQEWDKGRNVRVEQDGRTFTLSPDFAASLKKESPLEEIQALGDTPLLVVHGSADETVPVSQAEVLCSRYPGSVTREIINGAEHRLLNEFDYVSQLTRDWIKARLAGL